MNQETKPFYLSKSFWVQIFMLIAMIVPQVHSFVVANLGESAAIWAVINIILRAISKDKLSLS